VPDEVPLRFGRLDRIFEKRRGTGLRLEFRCKVVFERSAPKYVWLDESQLPPDISTALLDTVEWAAGDDDDDDGDEDEDDGDANDGGDGGGGSGSGGEDV
jgi:hypothetical protein